MNKNLRWIYNPVKTWGAPLLGEIVSLHSPTSQHDVYAEHIAVSYVIS